jgi:hypothetical protein
LLVLDLPLIDGRRFPGKYREQSPEVLYVLTESLLAISERFATCVARHLQE